MYKFYLYAVSFYYALFVPKATWDPEHAEENAIGLVIGTFVHVLLMTAFFYFFDWPKDLFGISGANSKFFQLMGIVGIPLSIWIFLGFLHYPLILEDDGSGAEEARKELLKKGIDYERRRREISELAEMRKNDPDKYREIIFTNIVSWNSRGVFVDDYQVFHHGGYLERAYKNLPDD